MGCMKSYDCQELWHSVSTLPLNGMPQFKCNVCSPPWSTKAGKREASTKEHVPWFFCWIEVCTPQAITRAKTSYLLAGLITQFKQLLMHTAKNCNSVDQKASTDSLLGSLQCLLLNWTAWISVMHCWFHALPFQRFYVLLTFFSKCFSSFPHVTCFLSVLCQYLALGVYLPFWAAFPSNLTHRKRCMAGAWCVTYGIFTIYYVSFWAT